MRAVEGDRYEVIKQNSLPAGRYRRRTILKVTPTAESRIIWSYAKPIAVMRILYSLAWLLAFVIGALIVIFDEILGGDRGMLLLGAIWLVVALSGAWQWLWDYALEVEITGGEVRWRSCLRDGAAPLADLYQVSWKPSALSFAFRHHRGFDLPPVRRGGAQKLLERLAQLNPTMTIDIPRSYHFSALMGPGGHYHETTQSTSSPPA